MLLLLLFRRPGRGSDSRSKCHIEKQRLFRAIRFCAFSEEPGEPNLRHRTHASETGWISANFNPDPAWKNACNDLVQFFLCVSPIIDVKINSIRLPGLRSLADQRYLRVFRLKVHREN